MARTRLDPTISLADLERIVRDRRRALSKLERQRSRWQKKLDAVERRIAALAGSARGGRGSRPRNEMSLTEAIEQVLAQAGGAMNVGEIAEKVQAGGYRSGSANFRTIVNQRLVSEKRFKSAGRGVYQLDSAAAVAPASRKWKRTVKRKK